MASYVRIEEFRVGTNNVVSLGFSYVMSSPKTNEIYMVKEIIYGGDKEKKYFYRLMFTTGQQLVTDSKGASLLGIGEVKAMEAVV